MLIYKCPCNVEHNTTFLNIKEKILSLLLSETGLWKV